MIDLAPIRARFAAVLPELDERERRLLAAAEARAAGYGGIAAVSEATGLAASTIGRGLRELEEAAGARTGAPTWWRMQAADGNRPDAADGSADAGRAGRAGRSDVAVAL